MPNIDVPSVKFDDPDLYIVVIYEEVDMLDNLLRALATYKRHAGSYWPAKVVVRGDNRMSMGFGEDTEVRRQGSGMLVNALHMSLYNPYPERAVRRMPTRFQSERKLPVDKAGNPIQVFRSRRYVKKRKKRA